MGRTNETVIKFKSEEEMFDFHKKLMSKETSKMVNKYQYSNSYSDADDFQQIANLKLFETCKKFYGKDKKVGQVISYAKISIKGAFIDQNSLKKSKKNDMNDRKLAGQIKKIKEDDLCLNRRTSDVEIAKELGVDVYEIGLILNVNGGSISLDSEIDNEDGDSMRLSDITGDIEEGYEKVE